MLYKPFSVSYFKFHIQYFIFQKLQKSFCKSVNIEDKHPIKSAFKQFIQVVFNIRHHHLDNKVNMYIREVTSTEGRNANQNNL